jgi:hypothetical protein
MRWAAAAAFLLVGAAMSYLVWGRWDGVDPRPFVWWTLLALAGFHVLTGFAIGRWWAVLLPLAWSAVSVGAGGYDIPVATQLLFQAPFFWMPALAAGVGLRKVAEPRLRARAS